MFAVRRVGVAAPILSEMTMIGPADLEAWIEDADERSRSERSTESTEASDRRTPAALLESGPLPLAVAAMITWRRHLFGRHD